MGADAGYEAGSSRGRLGRNTIRFNEQAKVQAELIISGTVAERRCSFRVVNRSRARMHRTIEGGRSTGGRGNKNRS
jgi:hypothetical protein